MRISWIEIENFRVFQDFHFDLSNELSLIVGRNNSGKTSVLLALEKLTSANSPRLVASDLNLAFLKSVSDAVANGKLASLEGQGVAVRVCIDYDEKDCIAKLRPAMMDLDPENNSVIVEWRYGIDEKKVANFVDLYQRWVDEREGLEKTPAALQRFLGGKRMSLLFTPKRFALETRQGQVVENGRSKKIDDSDARLILGVASIRVPRGVANTDSSSSLSAAASKYRLALYQDDDDVRALLDNKLDQADADLSSGYEEVFSGIIEDVKAFGGVRKGESIITVESDLGAKDVLDGSIRVRYSSESDEQMPSLPEGSNGLGYMNLISILMEVSVAFKRIERAKESETPAVCLLFIEEPEAHTHPQLQRIFMTRIREMLEKRWTPEGEEDKSVQRRSSLQTVVTTHSAHIVASASFDDIKYFLRDGNHVVSRNLSELEALYAKSKDGAARFKFLTQYLTVSRADILFADGLVLFEGDTERILLPAMIQKHDASHRLKGGVGERICLASRHISLVEVGRHSQVFDCLIRFLGVPTLIITDADYCNKDDRTKTPFMPGCRCGNDAATHFLGDVAAFKSDSGTYISEHRTTKLVYIDGKDGSLGSWKEADPGQRSLLCFAMQGAIDTAGGEYKAYSFEDAFFATNREFVVKHRDSFACLENRHLITNTIDPYEFANKCIGSKPSFAMDVLLNSDYSNGDAFGGWATPQYIEEGLSWLAEN